jgi:predicted RNase H-like nuclease
MEDTLLRKFIESKHAYLDPEFYKHIGSEDLVEVYRHPSHVQIYCNDRFLKITSYTLQQIRSIPFSQLYWRSPSDQTEVLARAAEVLNSGKKAQPWNVHKHELIEMMHSRRRTYEIEMKWLAPVIDEKTNAPMGIATIQYVNPVFEWRDDL